ncbi:MAG TPA: hypothetical protein VI653_24305 [Steroidobacteraceae bacterium]
MRIRMLLAAACLAMGSVAAAADSDSALPPMHFLSSVAGDELFTALKANPAFGRLDKEAVGSPIVLLVTHSLRPTAAGKATGLLSAVTTGVTLGLLPVVTNNSLVVTYSVRVNGKDVATHSYERTFTRAVNIWANKNDTTHGLGKEGLEWVESTAGEFARDALLDAKLADLKHEYDFYFGAQAKN